MPQVQTKTIKRKMLVTLSADTTTLSGADMHLYTNDYTPTDGNDSTAFTLPTWTGYSAETFTWNTPYITPAGRAELVGDSVFFLSGSDADTICFGNFLLAQDGTVVYAERFTTPVSVVGVVGITIVPLIDLENI